MWPLEESNSSRYPIGGTTRGWSLRRIDSLTAARFSLPAAASASKPSSPSSASADLIELKVKMLFVDLGILGAAVAAGEFCADPISYLSSQKARVC